MVSTQRTRHGIWSLQHWLQFGGRYRAALDRPHRFGLRLALGLFHHGQPRLCLGVDLAEVLSTAFPKPFYHGCRKGADHCDNRRFNRRNWVASVRPNLLVPAILLSTGSGLNGRKIPDRLRLVLL